MLVVFRVVDVATLLIQVLVQGDALIAGQCAVSLVGLLCLTVLTATVAQLLRFVVGHLTRAKRRQPSALSDLLALIYTRVTNSRSRRGPV
jgi:hypothetical protein